MDQQLISHVFAAVQSLEKCLANTRRLLRPNDLKSKKISQSLPQQEKVVQQMRRTANRLQLEIAKEDWNAAVRSLRIFYGLHYMIRSDVTANFVAVSREWAAVEKTMPQSNYCH